MVLDKFANGGGSACGMQGGDSYKQGTSFPSPSGLILELHKELLDSTVHTVMWTVPYGQLSTNNKELVYG